jgi:hypothetical protein
MTKSKVTSTLPSFQHLPVLRLSQMKTDMNNGEGALEFIRKNIVELLRDNGGVMEPEQLNDILADVNNYYRVSPDQDDTVQFLSIKTYDIRKENWDNARILKLDALKQSGLKFESWASIDAIEQQAVASNNQRAVSLVGLTKKTLESLFRDQGFSHEQDTIKSLALQLQRVAINDTVDPSYSFQYWDTYQGFLASYKTAESFGRALLVCSRNSNATMANIREAIDAATQKELGAKQSELQERQLALDAKQAAFDAKREEFDARLEALELIIGDRQTGKTI